MSVDKIRLEIDRSPSPDFEGIVPPPFRIRGWVERDGVVVRRYGCFAETVTEMPDRALSIVFELLNPRPTSPFAQGPIPFRDQSKTEGEQ